MPDSLYILLFITVGAIAMLLWSFYIEGKFNKEKNKKKYNQQPESFEMARAVILLDDAAVSPA